MANILIHARQTAQQAEILSSELEKTGHHVEISDSSHPVRLIIHRYDVLHILAKSLPLSLRDYILVLTAKALGVPVVVTTYSDIANDKRTRLHIKAFDCLTIHQIKELKKLRTFTGHKMILSCLPEIEKINPVTNISPSLEQAILLPVLNSFSELPSQAAEFPLFVEASTLAKKLKASVTRKQWQAFIEKHPGYQKAILILDQNNVVKLATDFRLAVFMGHLKLDAPTLSKYIELSLSNNWLPILTEYQASGFSEFWQPGKNCWILNQRFEHSHKCEPAEMTEIMKTLSRLRQQKSDFYQMIEPKLNELSRLYFKLISQKTSLLKTPSAKMGT